MPVAEGRGGGLRRAGGGAISDGAGVGAGVGTGLWAANSQTHTVPG